MTADSIMPVLVNASTEIIAAWGNAEIFEGISYLEALLSLFALSIILDIVLWIRSRGMNFRDID